MDRENYLGAKLKTALPRIANMQIRFAKRYIYKVSESKEVALFRTLRLIFRIAKIIT